MKGARKKGREGEKVEGRKRRRKEEREDGRKSKERTGEGKRTEARRRARLCGWSGLAEMGGRRGSTAP